jgi:hypothetical protein
MNPDPVKEAVPDTATDHYDRQNQGQGNKPTIEAVHRDVEFANKYRLALFKHLLTLAAAILAFTVSFRPTLTRVDLGWLMWGGWIALGVSLFCGMLNMLLWSHYYISYRDYDWKGKGFEGKAHRHFITAWRRFMMFFQFLGFAAGVLGIAIFAAVNFQNVPPPK